jgi:hypothetical protein
MSVHLTVMFPRFDRATPQLLFKNDHYTTGKGSTSVGPQRSEHCPRAHRAQLPTEFRVDPVSVVRPALGESQ